MALVHIHDIHLSVVCICLHFQKKILSKVSECNFRFDAHFDKMELLKLFLKLLVLVPSYI